MGERIPVVDGGAAMRPAAEPVGYALRKLSLIPASLAVVCLAAALGARGERFALVGLSAALFWTSALVRWGVRAA
jgi:hypothetical protein